MDAESSVSIHLAPLILLLLGVDMSLLGPPHPVSCLKLSSDSSRRRLIALNIPGKCMTRLYSLIRRCRPQQRSGSLPVGID